MTQLYENFSVKIIITKEIVNMPKFDIFKTGDHLRNGDYLISENGLFCASLNDDGNLCVTRGSQPDFSQSIWCSGKTASKGSPHCAYLHNNGDLCIYNSEWPDGKTTMWCSRNYGPNDVPHCLFLHDDGNLCIYHSEWPNDHTCMWCSGKTDPVENVEIRELHYDMTNLRVSNPIIKEFGIAEVDNNTDMDALIKQTFIKELEETSEWSGTVSVKITVSKEAKIGIPEIGEAGASVQVEAGVSFTYREVTTRIAHREHSIEVPASAHKKTSVLSTIEDSVLILPYKAKGIAILKSGTSLPFAINGEYTGTSSHHIKDTISQSPLEKQTVLEEPAKVAPKLIIH